jgi:DNA polymerase
MTRLSVPVAAHDDFEGWRDSARRLIQAGVAPDRVRWSLPGEAVGDLFAVHDVPLPPADAPPVRASRDFLDLAGRAALHSDPRRFDVLYRLLWRLQAAPRLMADRADPDVRSIDALARVVRRDIHKMRAFVRFRVVEDEHYVAWFEPSHHILRANAGFFVRRFAAMRWSILTPQGALHWDGQALREGPPASRADAPAGDPAEALWRTYYAAIFNPARLKVDAMVKEMPRRYWKNLPEADLIPDLIATAQAREAAMIALGGQDTGRAPATPAALDAAVAACRRCAIGCNGTRAVPGDGPADARLMIVGEQPGDHEERAGRPFVGPAGQVLRVSARAVGLDLAAVRMTNAVRHFKHWPQAKLRLHQTPTAREIDTCRWWLDAERALVRPRVVLALGASAARAVLGRTVSVQQERGRFVPLDDGARLLITSHPAYLLRLGEAARADEAARFAADLALAARG